MKQLLVRITQKAKSLAKRGTHLSAAIVMLSGVTAAALPATATAKNLTSTPRVSFTFDDGLTSALTKAAPALAAHGVTGTNYIITDCVGSTGTCAADEAAAYMTWEQIAQLKAFGWEIASHTKSHIQLATDKPSVAALESQLKDSQAALKAHGYEANNLAFPYGDYDSNVLAQTAKYYESARGFADLGYNTWPYDQSLIVNQQVQGNVTVAQVKAYIDTAITNNQWLVLTFHEIRDTASTAADDYQYSTANLEAIAAYVQEKQAAGQIKSVNVNDGLVGGTNLMPNGSFSNGMADGWSTDDAANITADSGNNGRYPDPTHAISLKSASTAATDTHLFSPQVAVSSTDSYVIKNYVNILGGEVDFYIDEYAADGTTWLNGQYFPGIAYNSTANAINVRDINFKYTPTAGAAKARLQVIVHGANVNAYYDGSEWLSVNEVATPPADTTAPTISGVGHNSVTASGATVSWTTSEASDSRVEYGTSTSYGAAVASATLTANHSLVLSGLAAGTSYHYRVVSKDAAGNTSTSADFTFTTATSTTPGTTVGDFTNDGSVNDDDATILFANWGSAPTAGDLNNSGVVDDDDATILFANWSK